MTNITKQNQKKVVFLFGGPGAEHEVSISTAKSALPSFENQFVLLPVFITKENRWIVAEDYISANEAWSIAEQLLGKKSDSMMLEVALDEIEKKQPNLFFIGLHGQFGEDGSVQSLLEARGLPYTGSDSEASAFAMDKPRVLQQLQNEGIPVPEFLEVTLDTIDKDIKDFVDYISVPIVVLPADSGSSVGVTIVRDEEQLIGAINRARQYSKRVLVTQYIKGREVTAGALVISQTELSALPPTELIPRSGHDFFDYDAKYIAGQTKEVTPPELPETVIEAIKALALRLHKIVGADGYSRTDMILREDGVLHVLEINTLPGLTPTSLIPQEAQAFGLSFPQLLTTICNNIDQSSQEYITAVE